VFTFEVLNSIDRSALYSFLANVEPLYPNFKSWFNFTFCNSLGTGQRLVVLAHNGYEIVGVALLKKSISENKICTFYVSPKYRGGGVGNDLMGLAISTLDSDNIQITVSNERNAELAPLLQSKGFSVCQSVSGLYRPGASEYFYKL
jgi:ribosomal protein S18 acetylase RimI-like enzyme